MINSKAWLEGRGARAEGVPEYKNPYRRANDFQSWLEGWRTVPDGPGKKADDSD
jgi:ribosome modulation factor